MNRCIIGNCIEVLPTLEAGSVYTCVTSPPYWGLRDYGHVGQLGHESTPEAYVNRMVDVFREVRRALRDDGTLWLNLGDSYCSAPNGNHGADTSTLTSKGQYQEHAPRPHQSFRRDRKPVGGNPHRPVPKLKPKDLVGIPWRVAFALQADGWYLRQDIIWHKPNPMPESVRDRCTKSHEYIFLLSKSNQYYFDADAIAEPLAYSSVERLSQPGLEDQVGSDRVPGKTNGNMKAVARHTNSIEARKTRAANSHKSMPTSERNGIRPYTGQSTKDYSAGGAQDASETKRRIVDAIIAGDITTRNKRSVWTVTTKPFSGAHFATFPPDLIEPCILAGCPGGGVVLDPFFGSGTTGQVAQALGRQWIGIELNPEYEKLSRERTAQQGMVLA